jgi:prolyl 4-hydroxylase
MSASHAIKASHAAVSPRSPARLFPERPAAQIWTSLAQSPAVEYADDYLSPALCAAIIRLGAAMTSAEVVGMEAGERHPARSNTVQWLHHMQIPDLARVCEAIAYRVGIGLERAEMVQLIHYAVGAQYRPHFDAFDIDTPVGHRHLARGGQRWVTALGYLNDVAEGGATVFPALGLEVAAKAGRLLIFDNVDPHTGLRHPGSLHGGAPVIRGEKWAFNLWFRAEPLYG